MKKPAPGKPASAPAPKAAQAPQKRAPPVRGDSAKPAAAPPEEDLARYVPTEDERRWAFAAHAGAILVGVVAPLVTLAAKRDRPWVRLHSRESLDFQLTIHAVEAVGFVLTLVGVGGFVVIGAWGVGVIFALYGATKAWSGAAWRYPVSIKFLKAMNR